MFSPYVEIFNFKGVASRSEFLYFYVPLVVLTVIIYLADPELFFEDTGSIFEPYEPIGVYIFGLLFFFWIMLAELALSIRRLRDGGWSKFWMVSWAMYFGHSLNDTSDKSNVKALIFFIVCFIICITQKTMKEETRTAIEELQNKEH